MLKRLHIPLAIIFSSIALTGCEGLFNTQPPANDEPTTDVIEHVYVPPAHPHWANISAGQVLCDKGKQFTIVRIDVGNNIDINWEGRHYTLYNVVTQSGAYRYEDAQSGLVLVQVPSKMQLFNSKLGQRLADSCMQ